MRVTGLDETDDVWFEDYGPYITVNIEKGLNHIMLPILNAWLRNEKETMHRNKSNKSRCAWNNKCTVQSVLWPWPKSVAKGTLVTWWSCLWEGLVCRVILSHSGVQVRSIGHGCAKLINTDWPHPYRPTKTRTTIKWKQPWWKDRDGINTRLANSINQFAMLQNKNVIM